MTHAVAMAKAVALFNPWPTAHGQPYVAAARQTAGDFTMAPASPYGIRDALRVCALYSASFFAGWAALTASGASAGSPPAPAASARVIVPAATTHQFTQGNATWSLAPGSAGSITAAGLYTAPAHVDAVHVVNGVQILPTDHIYYAKITNLPIIPHEATILTQITKTPGAYTGSGMGLTPNFHNNVLDDTMPTIPMTFLYTGAKSAINFNGQYQFVSGNNPGSPQIGVPGEYIQSGIYQSHLAPVDRHIFGTNKDNGVTYEIYVPHPLGSDKRDPSSNAISGSFYGLTVNPYNIGPATVAGGQLLSAGQITAEEIRTHKIDHVSFFTMPNGAIAAGAKCGNPPAIVQCFIWPATARAYAGGDYIPYGARFRLKADVDTVNNPATGKPFSGEAQAVFQSWKDYGVMLSDGGSTGADEVDVDVMEDYGLGTGLLFEVNNSKSADGLKVGDWHHWDIVDESSLELPGGNLSGQVNQNNPYVHPAFATAIATDKSTHKQTSYPIILQGVTVGVPHSVETVQSGVQMKLESWVRGSANGHVHWSMSPTLGTLTPAGLYTAPAVTAPASTLLTATSEADPQASTTVRMMVFPAGDVYMRLATVPVYGGKPYTDSRGHVWQTEFTGDLGFVGHNNFLQYGTGASAPGKVWPVDQTDWQIWQFREANFGGDFYYRLHVPNGTYTVTLYNGIGGVGGTLAPHAWEFAIECMGKVVNPHYDLSVEAAGHTGVPLKYTMTATVTNGVLTFAERQLFVAPATPRVSLNAFSIERQQVSAAQ